MAITETSPNYPAPTISENDIFINSYLNQKYDPFVRDSSHYDARECAHEYLSRLREVYTLPVHLALLDSMWQLSVAGIGGQTVLEHQKTHSLISDELKDLFIPIPSNQHVQLCPEATAAVIQQCNRTKYQVDSYANEKVIQALKRETDILDSPMTGCIPLGLRLKLIARKAMHSSLGALLGPMATVQSENHYAQELHRSITAEKLGIPLGAVRMVFTEVAGKINQYYTPSEVLGYLESMVFYLDAFNIYPSVAIEMEKAAQARFRNVQ